jgi:hypothetical protein
MHDLVQPPLSTAVLPAGIKLIQSEYAAVIKNLRFPGNVGAKVSNGKSAVHTSKTARHRNIESTNSKE